MKIRAGVGGIIFFLSVFYLTIHSHFTVKKNGLFKKNGQQLFEEMMELEQQVPILLESAASTMKGVHSQVSAYFEGAKLSVTKNKDMLFLTELSNAIEELVKAIDSFNEASGKFNRLLKNLK
ncbi:hypothetical protein IPH25_04325 [bacterium]|nr:MAG: hypothetical protein IPG37_01320 [bacterium]QQR61673.1 MAG: hypothetical protein IPH25_04325 [bacterium]